MGDREIAANDTIDSLIASFGAAKQASMEVSFPELDDSLYDANPDPPAYGRHEPETHVSPRRNTRRNSHILASLHREPDETHYPSELAQRLDDMHVTELDPHERVSELCSKELNTNEDSPTLTDLLLPSPVQLNQKSLMRGTGARMHPILPLGSEDEEPPELPRAPFNSDSTLNGDNVLEEPTAWPSSGVDGLLKQEFSDKLSLTDWRALERICSFMDIQLGEEVSSQSCYNSQDVRDAASALRIAEPQGALRDCLLNVGLTLPNYAKNARPWSAALSDLRHEVETEEHKKHVRARQEEQAELALALCAVNIKREYFQRYRVAYQDDIQRPDQQLAGYTALAGKVKLQYLRKWRCEVQEVQSLSQSAAQMANFGAAGRAYAALRQGFFSCRLMALEAEAFHKQRVIETYTLFWRDRSRKAERVSRRAASISKFGRLRPCFSRWRQLSRVNDVYRRRDRNLKSQLLRSMSAQVQAIRSLERASISVRIKQHVHLWRKKLAGSVEVSMKGVSLENHHTMKLASLWFGKWRREHKLVGLTRERERRCKAQNLGLWRNELLVAQFKSSASAQLAKRALATWRSKYRRVQYSNLQLASVAYKENASVARAAFREIRAKWREQRHTYLKAAELRDKLLKQRGMLKLRAALQKVRQESSKVVTYRTRALKKISLARIRASSRSRQASRLRRTTVRCSEGAQSRRASHVVGLWRSKAVSMIRRYEQVSQLTNRASLAAVLDSWKKVRQDLLMLEIRSRQERDFFALRKGFRLLRESHLHNEEIEEAANYVYTSRLASIFKSKLRKWLHCSMAVENSKVQAHSFAGREQKRAALEILQKWRDSVRASDETNVSLVLARGSARAGASPTQTPRRRQPMSPVALEKWTQSRLTPRNAAEQRPWTPLFRQLSTPQAATLSVDENIRSVEGTPTRPRKR